MACKKGGILTTTYIHWDDPPTTVDGRNPKANHRLDGAKTPLNNGISTTFTSTGELIAGFLNHQLTWQWKMDSDWRCISHWKWGCIYIYKFHSPHFFSVVYIPTVLIPTVFPRLLWCWEGGSRDPRTGSHPSSAGEHRKQKCRQEKRWGIYCIVNIFVYIYFSFIYIYIISCICILIHHLNEYIDHIVLVHVSLLYIFLRNVNIWLFCRSICKGLAFASLKRDGIRSVEYTPEN